MIKRFVRMSFAPEKVEDFKHIFKTSRERIREFEGCCHVELLEDVAHSNVFFTFSIWQSEAHLNRYRESDLFAGVWAKTKVLFNEKPRAWSLNELKFN